jgi:hypothetical protein
LGVLHFELCNTLAERCSTILNDDSFDNISQFDILVQKQGKIKDQ